MWCFDFVALYGLVFMVGMVAGSHITHRFNRAKEPE